MESLILKDPNHTRVVKALPLPPHKPLPKDEIFKHGRVDWQLIRTFLRKEGRISGRDFEELILMAINIFSNHMSLSNRILTQSHQHRRTSNYCW